MILASAPGVGHGGVMTTAEWYRSFAARYLGAPVAAFAQDSGVTQVAIREPAVAGFVHFGVEPAVDGDGLAGLFAPDLAGYHDGAQVPAKVAVELVRAMLRDSGAWCRLEADDRFFVHVGWDQYVYVGSAVPRHRAVALTHQLGLFVESLTQSPYDAQLDDEPAARCADASFWADLMALTIEHGAVLLEEGYLHNASRWHRITTDTVDACAPGWPLALVCCSGRTCTPTSPPRWPAYPTRVSARLSCSTATAPSPAGSSTRSATRNCPLWWLTPPRQWSCPATPTTDARC